ncbi:hypothetical protein MICRO8M_130027 [Microbacterium sp. 8M]|nr:hypothetical protein MICRO8M_130027 [Microbacterium sp. 8M]
MDLTVPDDRPPAGGDEGTARGGVSGGGHLIDGGGANSPAPPQHRAAPARVDRSRAGVKSDGRERAGCDPQRTIVLGRCKRLQ